MDPREIFVAILIVIIVLIILLLWSCDEKGRKNWCKGLASLIIWLFIIGIYFTIFGFLLVKQGFTQVLTNTAISQGLLALVIMIFILWIFILVCGLWCYGNYYCDDSYIKEDCDDQKTPCDCDSCRQKSD